MPLPMFPTLNTDALKGGFKFGKDRAVRAAAEHVMPPTMRVIDIANAKRLELIQAYDPTLGWGDETLQHRTEYALRQLESAVDKNVEIWCYVVLALGLLTCAKLSADTAAMLWNFVCDALNAAWNASPYVVGGGLSTAVSVGMPYVQYHWLRARSEERLKLKDRAAQPAMSEDNASTHSDSVMVEAPDAAEVAAVEATAPDSAEPRPDSPVDQAPRAAMSPP